MWNYLGPMLCRIAAIPVESDKPLLDNVVYVSTVSYGVHSRLLSQYFGKSLKHDTDRHDIYHHGKG